MSSRAGWAVLVLERALHESETSLKRLFGSEIIQKFGRTGILFIRFACETQAECNELTVVIFSALFASDYLFVQRGGEAP